MNFFQILSEIEKVDPEVYDRLDSRRSIFKNMAGVGQKLTAAALPLFVGAVFNKVYAQTPAGIGVVDVLNLALKLEYLEAAFYATTNRTAINPLLSSVNQSALNLIATDEANHVQFLRTTITTVLNGAAAPIPTATTTFDFTAGGRFAGVASNAAVYLAVAQALEDTGVRAYKGAAPIPSVMANKTVLTAALNIHSVEARHASHIRSMRRGGSTATLLLNATNPSNTAAVAPYSGPTGQPKSWISGTDGGGPVPMPGTNRGTDGVYGAGNNTGAPTGVTYLADDNTTQGPAPGVNLATAGIAGITSTSAYSEAFDEGLDAGTVITIANLFSFSGNYFG